MYDLELAKLKDCLDVAQEWESILKQRSELKSRHTVVETLGMLLSEKVDRSKNRKLFKGSGIAVPPEYLAGELAGEGGMVSRTSFMKFAVRRHRDRTLVRSPLLIRAHAWCRRVC